MIDRKFARRGELSLALLFILYAQRAQAFFDPPWITPATPRAGEIVSVNIRDGLCDAIFERPGYPQITQQGNAIHLVEYGHHWTDDGLCVYENGALTEPIGTFPPGDYVLTADLVYTDEVGHPQVLTIGVVPFTVTGVAASLPVPTLRTRGYFVLVLLISGFSVRTLCRGHAEILQESKHDRRARAIC